MASFPFLKISPKEILKTLAGWPNMPDPLSEKRFM